MHGEGDADGHGTERGEQDRRGRAVLDDPDLRMYIRVQMVDEMLERGVEELGGENSTAREQHDGPPKRPRRRGGEADPDGEEVARLNLKTGLGAQCEREPLQCEAQADPERLILVDDCRSIDYRIFSRRLIDRLARLSSRMPPLLTHVRLVRAHR